jgi:xylulokinase
LRFGLSELTRLGIRATKIVLTGGGANSPGWRQMIADVCNTPVTVLKTEEGAALGAALQALEMLGGGDIVSLTADHLEKDVEGCCQPEAGAVQSYEEIYGKYQRAVTRVADYYEDKP